MTSIQTSNGADTLLRNTKRLAKQAKRASRDLKRSAEHAVDETARQARAVRRATGHSIKMHPIAWTSAALGAAAVVGLLALRRSA